MGAATVQARIHKHVQKKVNTMWELHRLSEKYRSFVISVHESGVLQAKEAEMLLHPLANMMRRVDDERRKLSANLHKAKAESCPPSTCALTTLGAVVRIQRTFRSYKTRRALLSAVTVEHSDDRPRFELQTSAGETIRIDVPMAAINVDGQKQTDLLTTEMKETDILTKEMRFL